MRLPGDEFVTFYGFVQKGASQASDYNGHLPPPDVLVPSVF